jgi:hypothetical protein
MAADDRVFAEESQIGTMSFVSLSEIRDAAKRISSDRAQDSDTRRVGHGRPAADSQVRAAATGRRIQDPRRHEHAEAAAADALKRGVITYLVGQSRSGRGPRGVALGAPAVIVMPTTAPAIKVAGVKRWGAEVISRAPRRSIV